MSVKTPVAPTRKIAIELGLTRYKAKKPCKHGHISERSTVSGNCCECLLTVHAEKRRSLERKWAENNADHLRSKASTSRHKSRIEASNSRVAWSSDQISVIMRKKANGKYVLTADRLAEIMGRSKQAIEHMRQKVMDGSRACNRTWTV